MRKNKYLKTDYLPNSLPRTRRAQFFDLISSNYGTYFKLGLILLLFAIPFLAVIIAEPFYKEYLNSSLQSEGLAEDVIANYCRTAGFFISIVKVICLLILVFPFAGLGRINREMSFSKGVIFGKDFVLGIKQNWKSYLLIGFVLGVLLFAIESITTLMVEALPNSSAYILSGIMYGIYFLIIVTTNMMMLANSTIYTLKFSHSFLNCFRFTIKNIFVCLLFVLLPIGLYFLQLWDLRFVVAAIYALLIVFVLPLYSQAWHLYCLSKFDLYINKDNYPDIYLKGLYIDSNEKGELYEK